MNRLFSSALSCAAASVCLSTALGVAAQQPPPPPKPEEAAIKYRKAAFTLMAAHFGPIAAMANGRIPFDAKVVAENAEIATYMSKLPYTHFIPGSDKGDTRADPKIWAEMDRFKAAAARMQDEMAKLNVAAKGGNLDAIKAAVGETVRSCKACHDSYRKE